MLCSEIISVLFCESLEKHKYTLWEKAELFSLEVGGAYIKYSLLTQNMLLDIVAKF
jgi:hypothetical protein